MSLSVQMSEFPKTNSIAGRSRGSKSTMSMARWTLSLPTSFRAACRKKIILKFGTETLFQKLRLNRLRNSKVQTKRKNFVFTWSRENQIPEGYWRKWRFLASCRAAETSFDVEDDRAAKSSCRYQRVRRSRCPTRGRTKVKDICISLVYNVFLLLDFKKKLQP